MPRLILLLAISFIPSSCALAQTARTEQPGQVTVTSPSGEIRAQLGLDAKTGNLKYSIERDGKRLIGPSSVDVRLDDTGSIAAGASMQNVTEREID
jgi:Glycosyl-hydrolase 97 N-terminal